ncbi:hypothetical protein C4D60_Mb10t23190 [Musa balbisiana]|uniref:glutaredoxin-dependent peroxiredoxin n=1 Tax=Musa balbisiana TaxID=52838 RepID=A0A4S8J1P0_MUSBA|nr:hypothetical protein C4D60_Mb10t23190 [Musa balbisiana]
MASTTRAGLLPSPSLLRSASAALLPPPPMIASSLRTLSSPSRRLLLHPALKPTRPDLPTFRVRAARTVSGSVSLGFRAPHFELPEPLTGKVWTLDDFESCPALLVMFICNHCPFVKHLKRDITKLTSFYMEKGLGVVAISSNSSITHPQVRRIVPYRCFNQGSVWYGTGVPSGTSGRIKRYTLDGPEFMAEEAKLFKYPFPYLFDESQDVARAFGAVCTPEFFVFKKDGRRPFELFYRGQFDDSRPSNNVPITGRDLSRAIDCVLSGQLLTSAQKPSVGCSIKWHPKTT